MKGITFKVIGEIAEETKLKLENNEEKRKERLNKLIEEFKK